MFSILIVGSAITAVQCLEKLFGRLAGQQSNVEIARRGIRNNVRLLAATEHRYRDRVAHQKVELALTRQRLRKLRILQRLTNV